MPFATASPFTYQISQQLWVTTSSQEHDVPPESAFALHPPMPQLLTQVNEKVPSCSILSVPVHCDWDQAIATLAPIDSATRKARVFFANMGFLGCGLS